VCLSHKDSPEPRNTGELKPLTLTIPLYFLSEFDANGFVETDKDKDKTDWPFEELDKQTAA
jgi:hypothetical protein